MTTVTVSASKCYDIRIGAGLLADAGNAFLELKGAGKVCIVSDSHVFPRYGAALKSSLETAGFTVCSFVFPAGEASKNGSVFLELLNFLAEHGLTRTDLIAALGGGVVGDLAGFAAACYLRGIRFVQLPTSLLAAVDSSVGGKTAIDLMAGKNLAGAFWQPSLVLCDTDTLATLPRDIFTDGCAEVIKYAILYDPELFALLERNGQGFDREAVIARCVQWKAEAVEQDEFDRGARQMLNLGHTFAHAVEQLSHFALSHGKAVSIGTAMAARIGQSLGICDKEIPERITALLERFGLPTKTDFTAAQLCSVALSDKKRSGDRVNLVIPERIGSCILRSTEVAALESVIQAGL